MSLTLLLHVRRFRTTHMPRINLHMPLTSHTQLLHTPLRSLLSRYRLDQLQAHSQSHNMKILRPQRRQKALKDTTPLQPRMDGLR